MTMDCAITMKNTLKECTIHRISPTTRGKSYNNSSNYDVTNTNDPPESLTVTAIQPTTAPYNDITTTPLSRCPTGATIQNLTSPQHRTDMPAKPPDFNTTAQIIFAQLKKRKHLFKVLSLRATVVIQKTHTIFGLLRAYGGRLFWARPGT